MLTVSWVKMTVQLRCSAIGVRSSGDKGTN